jgi:hypothetical protein
MTYLLSRNGRSGLQEGRAGGRRVVGDEEEGGDEGGGGGRGVLLVCIVGVLLGCCWVERKVDRKRTIPNFVWCGTSCDQGMWGWFGIGRWGAWPWGCSCSGTGSLVAIPARPTVDVPRVYDSVLDARVGALAVSFRCLSRSEKKSVDCLGMDMSKACGSTRQDRRLSSGLSFQATSWLGGALRFSYRYGRWLPLKSVI